MNSACLSPRVAPARPGGLRAKSLAGAGRPRVAPGAICGATKGERPTRTARC